jgi:hypothetical protein
MPQLCDLSVLKSTRYSWRSEKWTWTTHGFLDSGHDLAEHGLDAERVLLLAGVPVVRLGRHGGGQDETRRRERGRECNVRV